MTDTKLSELPHDELTARTGQSRDTGRLVSKIVAYCGWSELTLVEFLVSIRFVYKMAFNRFFVVVHNNTTSSYDVLKFKATQFEAVPHLEDVTMREAVAFIEEKVQGHA